MKKAPFLTIEGKPVDLGTKYWTVNTASLLVSDCIAGDENNTIQTAYFLNEVDAYRYADMVKLKRLLESQIKGLEMQAFAHYNQYTPEEVLQYKRSQNK